MAYYHTVKLVKIKREIKMDLSVLLFSSSALVFNNWQLSKYFDLASGGNTVVEHLPRRTTVGGSSPTETTGI